jgi:ribose transport system permease protein
VFLCFLVILHIFQTRTFLGRSINYTGGNIVAAELSGIPTKRVMILIYAICGFMSAVGAMVLFSRVSVTTPTVGVGFERDAIMSVVVGGTSLLGGKGSVIRTMMGVSLVILLSNCMNLLGVQTHLQEVLRGAVLVIAIWLDHRRHR